MLNYKLLLAVATILLTAAIGLPVCAAPDWTMRPGTIFHAVSQPDGTGVCLDAVEVERIEANRDPSYFVVKEMWKASSKIIVYTAPPSVLRRGQEIDVEGVIGTLPNGERAILNPRIIGYLDQAGNLLLHSAAMKGILAPALWQWKAELVSPGASSPQEAATPGEPSPAPLAGPAFYPTIASLLTANQSGNGAAVKLQCKKVVGSGVDPIHGDYVLLADDGASSTLKVYCHGTFGQSAGQSSGQSSGQSVGLSTASSDTTVRVNEITGQVRTEGVDTIVTVDGGPGFDPQGYVGNLQTAIVGTISHVETFADGTTVTVSSVVVTESDRVANVIYAQDTDRCMGIRVCYAGSRIISRGMTVNVTGVLDTNADGEREIISGDQDIEIVTAFGTVPHPLGMTNRDLGGSAFNVLTPGINFPTDAFGLYNKGLFVKIWGRVTAVDQNTRKYYIDDGSTVDNGSDNPIGVKVVWSSDGPATSVPGIGTFLEEVVGISSSEARESGQYARVLIVRRIATPIVSATASMGMVDLTWNGQDHTIYRVYRSTNQSGPFNLIATVSSGAYFDANVINGATYYYRVTAYTSGIEGAASEAMATVPDVQLPPNPPTTTINLDGTLGEYEWYVSPVTAVLTASDPESDFFKAYYKLDDVNAAWMEYVSGFEVSEDGEHQIFAYSEDFAGNMEDPAVSRAFKIDSTPPAIVGQPAAQPNSNGWYNSDVQIDYSAVDATSGLAAPEAADAGQAVQFSSTVSSEGVDLSDTASATDKAGNDASLTVSGLKIDKTAPALALISAPTGNCHVISYEDVVVRFTAVDVMSGIKGMPWAIAHIQPTEGWASPSDVRLNATLVGPNTYEVGFRLQVPGDYTIDLFAEDLAGNIGKTAAPISFGAGGFTVEWLPPISLADVYIMQDGSTVPVKFRLIDPCNNNARVNSYQYTVKVIDTSNTVWKTVVVPQPDPTTGGYHANIKTKDENNNSWPIGDYTVVIEGPGIWDVISGPYRSRYGLELVDGSAAKGKGRR